MIVLNFIDLNLKGDVLVNNFEDEVKIHPPQVGEELLYEVSYGFIPIGTIRLQVLENIEKNKIELHTVKCFIDSYNLPFVNLHYVMYSELDQNLWSHYFWFGNTSDPKSTWFVEYDFDYSKKNIQAKHGNMQSKKIHLNFKDSISNLYQDGLSLFYFARQNINSNQNHSLPTYMNEKKFKTYINYFGQNSESKIDAINYPIATKYFNGNIEYKGIYGLTGNFEGWFSRDNAAIPIKAKMKVLIGSVNIELIKWQRKNWTPPKI